MQGKTVVITGATSGIGQVAALRLAGLGARIVLVARSRKRGEATRKRLASIHAEGRHQLYLADLSEMSQVKRVAGEIAAAEDRVDVLINNAGMIAARRQVTTEGLERTFATNHMAYFLMTYGLREPLRAAGQARVVNTASRAHLRASLDFDDLQSEHDYRGFQTYGRSKLCNMLFTRELARRLEGSGTVAYALHPGFVATRFGNDAGGWFAIIIRLLKLTAISEQKGAETIVHLASSEQVGGASGDYFYQCRRETPAPQALDEEAARRLWTESERLAEVVW